MVGLLKLLEAVKLKNYNKSQGIGSIIVYDGEVQSSSIPIINHGVTDTQAVLAFAITVRFYPQKWWREFFWDAWIATTIQLGLLQNEDKEVLPLLWMKRAFCSEKWIETPDNVHYLILEQDKECKPNAADVSFSGTEGFKYCEGMKHYALDCTSSNQKIYCKHGLLLVKMIRCSQKESESSLNYICYHNAWFLYTLKLTKYFDAKPVIVICNDPSLTPYIKDYIAIINPKAKQVQHPRHDKPPQEDIETVRKCTKCIQNV